MRTPVVLLLALVLAGCTHAAQPAASDGADAAAGLLVLRGVVVDDAIRPVIGAHVNLDGGQANATTGPDGLFRFNTTAGAHVVRATKPGFADAVAQADLRDGVVNPLVKLVLVTDVSGLPYAETQKIEGYVECGTDTFNSHFAACGGPNVGSFILCAQAGICQGNLTDDSYIVIQKFDRTPTFLVVEVAWTATQTLGSSFSVWLGSATKEQLQFYPKTPSVWNITEGPSPLYGTMNSTMLDESGIGKDSWFLAQMFAGDSGLVPLTGMGVIVQQRFEMFFTSFYGYQPPADWRFSATGVAPAPPT